MLLRLTVRFLFNIASMVTDWKTGRMGSQPKLPVFQPIIIDTTLIKKRAVFFKKLRVNRPWEWKWKATSLGINASIFIWEMI